MFEETAMAGKGPEQVLGEYLAADTPGDWLVEEVAGYLFPGAVDETDDELDDVFSRMDDQRHSFFSAQYKPEELLQFEIRVQQGAGAVLRGGFREMPSPVVLLDVCLRMANPGDEVVIQQQYAGGDVVSFEALWPFGMDWAVNVTTPLVPSHVEVITEQFDDGEGVWEESGPREKDVLFGPVRRTHMVQAATAVVFGIAGMAAGLVLSRSRR